MSMFDRHCADDACISSQGHQYKRERWGDKVGLWGRGRRGEPVCRQVQVCGRRATKRIEARSITTGNSNQDLWTKSHESRENFNLDQHQYQYQYLHLVFIFFASSFALGLWHVGRGGGVGNDGWVGVSVCLNILSYYHSAPDTF